MPPPLDDKAFGKLVSEQDAFKLAIRGLAAIEAEIEEAMKDAFPDGVPSEIRRLGFNTRLALAVGLGIVPKQFQGAFKVLAKLRHDFAHGELQDLTAQRAKALVGAWPPDIFPKRVRDALAPASPRLTLQVVLTAARAAVRIAARVRKEEQERRENALRQSPLLQALRTRVESAASDELATED